MEVLLVVLGNIQLEIESASLVRGINRFFLNWIERWSKSKLSLTLPRYANLYPSLNYPLLCELHSGEKLKPPGLKLGLEEWMNKLLQARLFLLILALMNEEQIPSIEFTSRYLIAAPEPLALKAIEVAELIDDSELYQCINHGRWPLVRAMLKQRTASKETQLRVPGSAIVEKLVEVGRLWALRSVFELGARSTEVSLSIAIQRGRIAVLRALLNVPPIQPDEWQIEYLIQNLLYPPTNSWAHPQYRRCCNKATRILGSLLDHGARPTLRQMDLLVEIGEHELVMLVIGHRIPPMISDIVLNAALSVGDEETIIYLLDQGVRPTQDAYLLFAVHCRKLVSPEHILILMLAHLKPNSSNLCTLIRTYPRLYPLVLDHIQPDDRQLTTAIEQLEWELVSQILRRLTPTQEHLLLSVNKFGMRHLIMASGVYPGRQL